MRKLSMVIMACLFGGCNNNGTGVTEPQHVVYDEVFAALESQDYVELRRGTKLGFPEGVTAVEYGGKSNGAGPLDRRQLSEEEVRTGRVATQNLRFVKYQVFDPNNHEGRGIWSNALNLPIKVVTYGLDRNYDNVYFSEGRLLFDLYGEKGTWSRCSLEYCSAVTYTEEMKRALRAFDIVYVSRKLGLETLNLFGWVPHFAMRAGHAEVLLLERDQLRLVTETTDTSIPLGLNLRSDGIEVWSRLIFVDRAILTLNESGDIIGYAEDPSVFTGLLYDGHRLERTDITIEGHSWRISSLDQAWKAPDTGESATCILVSSQSQRIGLGDFEGNWRVYDQSGNLVGDYPNLFRLPVDCALPNFQIDAVLERSNQSLAGIPRMYYATYPYNLFDMGDALVTVALDASLSPIESTSYERSLPVSMLNDYTIIQATVSTKEVDALQGGQGMALLKAEFTRGRVTDTTLLALEGWAGLEHSNFYSRLGSEYFVDITSTNPSSFELMIGNRGRVHVLSYTIDD